MTTISTVIRHEVAWSDEDALGGWLSALSQAFLISLPFCAVVKLGVFGNFDANLALWPFLFLAPFLLRTGMLRRVIMHRGPEGLILRTLAATFLAAAVMTIIHGVYLGDQGVRAYGINPSDKALITSVVPIFLVVLTATAAAIGAHLGSGDLQRSLNIALWVTIGYVLLQLSWLLFANPIYDGLWPVLEGARDTGDVPYLERLGRINGPTTEPAELVKLLLLLFLPWTAFPAIGRPSVGRLAIVLTFALASLSIVGLILVPVAVVALIALRPTDGRIRLFSIGLVGAYALAGVVLATSFLDQLLARLSNLENDPSAIIRTTYNRAAVDLILEKPFAGLGWSNEIFYFPAKIESISYLWEVQLNLAEGDALTAKSLLLRLTMYLGIPLMLVLVGSIVAGLIGSARPGNDRDVARTRLTFALVGMASIIDGGIITSFYIWAAPAICLGFQMRGRLELNAPRTTSVRRSALERSGAASSPAQTVR